MSKLRMKCALKLLAACRWVMNHDLFGDRYTITNNLMDGISRSLYHLSNWIRKGL